MTSRFVMLDRIWLWGAALAVIVVVGVLAVVIYDLLGAPREDAVAKKNKKEENEPS